MLSYPGIDDASQVLVTHIRLPILKFMYQPAYGLHRDNNTLDVYSVILMINRNALLMLLMLS
jgi:hypothetical protein